MSHLEALRRALIGSVLVLAAGMAIALGLAPRLLDALKAPLAEAGLDPDTYVRVLQVTGGLVVAMRMMLWGGLLMALPFILMVAARFVFPGLTPCERRTVARALGFAVLLFAAGVAVGYVWVLPPVFQVMTGINAWLGVRAEFVDLADYVGFVLRLLMAFGLAYELPVVIVVLGRLELVTAAGLAAARRYVIVGLLIAAMLLTPPEPLSQLLMALPLIVLYELCIWVVWAMQRRR